MDYCRHPSAKLTALIDLIYVLEDENGPLVENFLLTYAEKKLQDLRSKVPISRPVIPPTLAATPSTATPTPEPLPIQGLAPVTPSRTPTPEPLPIQGLAPVSAESPDFEAMQDLNGHNLALLDKMNKGNLNDMISGKSSLEMHLLREQLTGEKAVNEKYARVVNEMVGQYKVLTLAAPDGGSSTAQAAESTVAVIKVYSDPELMTVGGLLSPFEVEFLLREVETLPESKIVPWKDNRVNCKEMRSKLIDMISNRVMGVLPVPEGSALKACVLESYAPGLPPLQEAKEKSLFEAVCTIFLDDGATGGLDFMDMGFEIRPECGTAVFWKTKNQAQISDKRTRHSVLSTSRGLRVLRLFFAKAVKAQEN